MWPAQLCSLALWLHFLIAARAENNAFVVPPTSGPNLNYIGNLVWKLGLKQTLQWATTVESYSIELYHQNLGLGAQPVVQIYSASGDGGGNKSYEWTVQTYGADLNASPIFFLWLLPKDDSPSFSCHYFNMTTNSLSSSSASSTSSTSTTSQTTAATSSNTKTTASANAAKTAGSSPNPSTNPKQSTNETAFKVGLGTGLGLGIPLVLIIGIWVGMRTVRQRRSSPGFNLGAPYSQDTGRNFDSTRSDLPSYQSYEMMEQTKMDDVIKFHEAPLNQSPAELEGPQTSRPG